MSVFKGLLVASALFALSAGGAFAEETDRALPLPAVDTQGAQTGAGGDRGSGGRLLLGHAGRVPACQRRQASVGRLFGRQRRGAHYEVVGSGTTGHAESVKIVFDPKEISFGQILRVYFSVMDPTELNYQGPDEGTQYRSEIFATTPEQLHIAQAYIAQLGKSLFGADRHQGGAVPDVLYGRGLSSGLPDQSPLSAIHCYQRSAEGGEVEAALSAALCGEAGDGGAE